MPVELETRLARVEEELLAARRVLHLRSGRQRRPLGPVACVGIALVTGWAAMAGGTRTLAAEDPVESVNKKMAVMEKELQAKIDALEVRVHKLETKPDNIDNNDDQKKAGADASSGRAASPDANAGQAGATNANPGQAGGTMQSVSNLAQRVTALERRTSFRAPFTVTDSQGSALFTVTENGMRGVKIFSGGVERVRLEASDEGGEVKALAPGMGEAVMSAREDENEVFVTGPMGGKAGRLEGWKEGGLLTVGSLGGRAAVLGAYKGPLGLRFFMKPQDEKARLGIGVLDNGAGGMILRGPSGNSSVELGSEEGTDHGLVQVFDNGTVRVETKAAEKGLVAVRNSAGNAVAFMTESSTGDGGNITLADPAGNGIVSAGYSSSEQGDICLDRKQHLYCVGVNLPLSMGR